MFDHPEYDPVCDHKVLVFRPGLCFEMHQQLHNVVQLYAMVITSDGREDVKIMRRLFAPRDAHGGYMPAECKRRIIL